MIDRVAGGVDDVKLRATERDMILGGQNDPVGQAGGPLHGVPALQVLRREQVARHVQAQIRHLVPRLAQAHGQLGPVFLFQIGHVAHVVDVRVAADHAHRLQAVVRQGLLQLLPLLDQACVQQDALVRIQAIHRDQLPAFQHPGVVLYLFQFHISSLLTGRLSQNHPVGGSLAKGRSPGTETLR